MEHSLSKKTYRGGNGYAGKAVYDDVFGGPPKFGVPTLSPRLEDYNEIFEGFHTSRGSSIPMLDLPAVDDAAADYCLDVRSSRFDYSEVFGGFDAVDFAVSYEELFGRSKGGAGGGGGDDSSDDAWTPAQSESLSDESDPSASLERNQSLSNGDLDQSFGGIKQLKVSHNKASTKTEEHMLNGTGYIMHSYAVPGFTAFINETQPSRKVVEEKLPLQESSDLNPSIDFGGRVSREKLLRKTKSHSSNTESTREIYDRNVNPLPGHEKQCSDGPRPQLSVSGISLKTQPSQLPPPSRPPPALTVNKKDPGILNSKLKASKSYTFEQMGGDTSPTYFDVEIDASSSAAVSAAAMKDAVEKAQAKLRSAKESMGKKKEGLQSRLKVSDNDLNEREEGVSKMNDTTDSLMNENMLGDFGGEDSRMRHHAREARDKLKKTAGSLEGQNSVSGNSVERKHGKEHKSSLGSRKTEVNVALTEDAQFYQMLGENYVNNSKVLNHNTKLREHEQNSRSTVEVFEQHEDGRNISDTLDACEWKEKQNLSQVPNGTYEWDENTDRQMLHKMYHRDEHPEKATMGPQVCDSKDQKKKLRGNQQLEEIETMRKEDSESENLIEIQLKEDKVEFEDKLNGSSGRLASEKRFKHTNEKQDHGQTQSFDSKYFVGIKEAVLQADNERRLKKSVEHDAKEKQQRAGSEREEKVKKQKDREREEKVKTHKDHEREEKVKTQKDHEREESERRVEQNYQAEENEKRFRKAFEQEKTKEQSKMIVEPEGNIHKLVSEIHENEEMVKESQKEEKNQYNLEEAPALEENARKHQATGERVENENIVTDVLENEEDEMSPKTTRGPEESKRTLQEGLESEKSRKVTFNEEGYEKKLDARIGEEIENMVEDAGDMVNFKGQNGVHEKVDLEEIDCRLNSDEDIGVVIEGKNLKGSYGAYVTDDVEVPQPTQVSSHDRDSDNIESTQEAPSCDGYVKSGIDLRDCDREAEEVVVPEELIEKAGRKAEEGMDSCHLHVTDNISINGGIGIGIAKPNIENDNHGSEMASELLNANIHAPSQVEGGKNTKEVQCTTDHKGGKEEFTSSQSQEQRDGEKIVDAPPVVFEGKRRNTRKSDAKITSQSIGKKDENRKTTLTPEEKEKQERLKREREQEKDRLRKIEEERERQREREKDMMSIDRATLEARERAFVENRERVERVTVDRAAAEVRQRALAEARERLEKACAEARERTFAGKSSMERSFSEKTSMEARLRAERAAVERAAAQARERAEKAAADTLSASSRSSGMRQNSSSSDLLDSNFQSMGSYSASRYTHSSAHGGGETESPQRCKARLERHQRTAERAQKALAEKNMRDLLAQKEQSERNRLAEGLDAEVKRWCSGKEGNLRALLSTLQYILGPDSGWQPVPLTDVITTVAVKKAYRKATLCVHPDKLQQRGATIHQKYICEKVFDLLKEAWNTFNSEER